MKQQHALLTVVVRGLLLSGDFGQHPTRQQSLHSGRTSNLMCRRLVHQIKQVGFPPWSRQKLAYFNILPAHAAR
jgi:hypothetical protein